MFTPLPPLARLAGAVTVLATTLVLVSCGGGSEPAADLADAQSQTAAPPERPARTGEPRTFAMGFLALPAALTEDAYIDVFDSAALHGDFVMIQRHVPWAELAPGASLDEETLATIDTERSLLDDRGLDLLFAIDPWDPTDRGRLAGDAPGDGFNDPAVVDAYLAYVELVLDRYEPRWLVLAVDLDQFAAARPGQLEAFEFAYTRAYRLVKERAPDTLAFATFQLEDLQGMLPWGRPHDPQWGLIIRFRSVIDIVAVSSFPSFIFPFQADIPPEYFSRLGSFDKPVALVPGGYASAPGRGGVTFGTAGGQRAFIERLLREAEIQEWELIAWVAPRDPAFAAAPPFDLVNRMGLIDRDGATKPAHQAWTDAASRPWTPLERRPNDEAAPAGGPAANAPPAG